MADLRPTFPVGALFCVINGPTRGPWSAAAVRADLRRTAATAGVRRRFAPHQLRHAHAVEMAHEGVPLIVIQRQLGHSNLGIPSIYLGHRQRRNHRHRPRPPRPDDPSQHTPALMRFAATARRAKRHSARPAPDSLLHVQSDSDEKPEAGRGQAIEARVIRGAA